MIEICGVYKKYDAKRGVSCQALNNISVTMPNKGMVFILGKSGSGKSTLLNIMGGLDMPDKGYLIIDGKSTAEFKQKDYDAYRNTYSGFIFQEFNLIETLSVEENVTLSLQLLNKKVDLDKVNAILKQVGLEGLNKRKINELSGGQKQRVAIARILIKDCNFVFADEPTGNLDTITGKQIFKLLKGISKNHLVVVVSHDRESAFTYADRIVEIKNGQIIDDITRTKGHIHKEFDVTSSAIIIPSNRALMPSEVKTINNQIKKGNKNIQFTENKFDETKPLKVSKMNKFKSIKPKMPAKHAWQMMTSNINAKKFRFSFIVILLAIAMTLYGFGSLFSFYDVNKSSAKTFAENGVDKISVSSGTTNSTFGFIENASNKISGGEFIEEFSQKFPNQKYYEGYEFYVDGGNSSHSGASNTSRVYDIKSTDDLLDMGYQGLLKGSFKPYSVTNYENAFAILITDYYWYAQIFSDSTLIKQTLSPYTVDSFRTYLQDDIDLLDDETKINVQTLLAKLDTPDGENTSDIEDITVSEKTIIFKALYKSTHLMDFVLHTYESMDSWMSCVLIKITGIIDTGITDKNISTIESILSKDSSSDYTLEENNLRADISYFYGALYGNIDDLKSIDGFYCLFVPSLTKHNSTTITNSLNSNVNSPNNKTIRTYNLQYKYNIHSNWLYKSDSTISLRNGYTISTQNSYQNTTILSPYLDEENHNKIGLYSSDILLNTNTFTEIFGDDAITKYFSDNTLYENDNLYIYLNLYDANNKLAGSIQYRVVGINNEKDFMMCSDESAYKLFVNDYYHESYMIMLSDSVATNEAMLNLLTKYSCFHRSSVSNTVLTVAAMFKVFELIFKWLTIIIAVFTVFLIMNFITTGIVRKTREIGVLRALGATRKSVSLIFLFESWIIGMLSGLVSILVIVCSLNAVNRTIINALPKFFGTGAICKISLLSFNFWLIPSIILVGLLVCTISTIIPMIKISKMKPSESMRSINN